MRRIICLLISVLTLTAVSAQKKVIESSAKKAPTWLSTAVDGHIVVTVNASSLAEAQAKVMSVVTERIILSVASNVSVMQSSHDMEVVQNDDVYSKSQFEMISKIKSANLPFLKGISPTKIKELYWVRVRDKKTGVENYEYSVLYPLSKIDLHKLQTEFQKLDDDMMAKVKALEEGIDDIVAVEEIKDAITELITLREYFFDDVRLKQVDGLAVRYRNLYDALSLAGEFVGEGKYRCVVMLNGQPVRCSKMPKVTSNCASGISVQPSDGAYIISYSTEDCLPEEDNQLDVQLRIEKTNISHRVRLSSVSGGMAATGAFSIVPEGKVVFLAESVDSQNRTVSNVTVRISLNNRGGHKFGLKSLEILTPDMVTPLVFDDINAVYSTKGIIQVKLMCEGTISLRKSKANPFGTVDGYITVANPTTGAIEKIKVSLPYTTNW